MYDVWSASQERLQYSGRPFPTYVPEDETVIRYAVTVSTLGAKVQCLQSLTSRRVKPGANLIPVFPEMVEDIRNIRPTNGVDIKDEVVCLLSCERCHKNTKVFPDARTREGETSHRLAAYGVTARYDLSKGGGSPKSSDTVFFVSGTKPGTSGRRREKCGNISGNKKKDGGGL